MPMSRAEIERLLSLPDDERQRELDRWALEKANETRRRSWRSDREADE